MITLTSKSNLHYAINRRIDQQATYHKAIIQVTRWPATADRPAQLSITCEMILKRPWCLGDLALIHQGFFHRLAGCREIHLPGKILLQMGHYLTHILD